MKKESLQFAAIALCISAACGSAYSANNAASSYSSGNSANAPISSAGTETSKSDAMRNTASNQNAAANENSKAAKDIPGADAKVPLNLNRASKVIGTNVEDASGNKIGDIKDVVLDRKSGQVAYAVVDFGGWLGMGDKYFAVPWKALKSGSNDRYVLSTSKDTLKKAPGFDKDHWPDMASESWNRENAQAYNQKPYWEESTASHHHMHSGSSGSSKGAGSSRSGAPSHKSSIEKEPVSKSQ